MATRGPWQWIDRSLLKIATGVINLNTDAFKMALCNNTQALNPLFTGGSGDARYADLTGELATANGYTVGGVALGSSQLTRSGSFPNIIVFSSASVSWTFTGGGVTFKYAVIYDNTGGNKDLLGVLDMDTGGGSVSSVTGLTFNPDATYGWLYGVQ